jgi:putative ATPase
VTGQDDLFAPEPQPAAPGRADPLAGQPLAQQPLAARMRPRTLDEVVGQQHLLGPGAPLRRLVEGSGAVSVILWGPPGTGKTTLATLVASASGARYRELSAVSAGVKDVRAIVEEARTALGRIGQRTVLFLDEVHRFSKAQQDALLPAVENRWISLVAATTENPFFSVISPLLSRSLLLTLQPLTDDEVGTIVDRAVADPRGLGGAVDLVPEAREHLLRLAAGDARRALTALEAAAGVVADRAAGGGEQATLSLADLELAVDRAAVRYDRDGDQHYDVVSAFIKSVRGSDPDAAVHYLARMLESGEDPRFVARRLMILASEDIGLADPTALGVAVAAAQTLELVGLPEARLALTQATLHLALAPKSNAVIRAYDSAAADVRAGRTGPVPPHLRDAHYGGATRLGHGAGYRYAHDHPGGVAEQQYPPDAAVGRDYLVLRGLGAERELTGLLARLRAVVRGGAATTRTDGPSPDGPGGVR